MEKERSALFDNVKFFLICAVVMGHLGNRYAGSDYTVACVQFWIYLFHMPAFIFVAGLFSKSTVAAKKWNKAVPYIFIYIAMQTMTFFVSVLQDGIAESSVDFFHENGIAWYALSMFWWYAITILIRNVHPVYVIIISLLISLVSGYSNGVDSFLVMQRTIIFYPFFYAGYITDLEKLQSFVKKPFIKIIGALLLIAAAFITYKNLNDISYWRYLFRGIRAYEKIGKDLPYEWGFAWRAAFYVISSVLTLSVISLIPSVKCFISFLGKKTLPVFVFHGNFIALMLYLIPEFKKWMKSGNIMAHCIVFMIIIVIVTSLKPFDYVLRLIMNVPSRYKSSSIQNPEQ